MTYQAMTHANGLGFGATRKGLEEEMIPALLVGPLAKLAGDLIDNLFETEEEKAAAHVKLIQLDQKGRLQDMQIQLSAILAEARSDDPWTSRARPTFLYLMYAVLVFLIFFGAPLSVFYPEEVTAAAKAVSELLNAIPEPVWWLFGTGYLGYTSARTLDKWKRPTPK
ncbi:3TM-type holin [Limibacillus halophilus]|uniref:Holin of 3TMs, for gene-transfer release n=1 Tax=Limibacillus halophilus TaxID=1579333 RepID=A0A839SX81_9PROT|nr:3TM-type holin [Limibacillus halophilus]MBB3065605.1 hypothetical protein [Limibacillus halophilus]